MADEEKSDFDPKSLEKRLRDEIPHESDALAFKVMGAYYQYMTDNKAKEGKIEDFRLGRNDAKKLAENVMDTVMEHVLKQYLLAEGVEYNKGSFNRKGAEALVRMFTGLDLQMLREQFENQKVTVDYMTQVGRQATQTLQRYHGQQIMGELSDYDNLEKARKHIAARLKERGITVDKPERINAQTAYEHLTGIASGIPEDYHKRYADHMKKGEDK